jgi:flagellar protein FlaG
MSNIQTANSYAQAGGMQLPVAPSQNKVASTTKSDAEVIAAVVSTEIKATGVNEAAEPTREVVAKAAAKLQEFVSKMGRNLSFSVDETTGYNVVRVINPQTGELIRQLPSEELLKIARDFERLNNVLVSQRA